jgi:hypothetical protein
LATLKSKQAHAKTPGRKEAQRKTLLSLCAFWDLAPLREMLLIVLDLFHSFHAAGPEQFTSARL